MEREIDHQNVPSRIAASPGLAPSSKSLLSHSFAFTGIPT
jgi:hypothetical protein